MFFKETPLKDAYSIEPEIAQDERGFFMRTFCTTEFEQAKLQTKFAQNSLSYNRKKGTIRGFHFQVEPFAEAKLIRCVRGSVHDVIIDLRKDSPTFEQTFAIKLDAMLRNSLYVPEGFAHGFQTLEDDSELLYQISTPFNNAASRGICHDDPFFNINWPLPVSLISQKDQSYPPYKS